MIRKTFAASLIYGLLTFGVSAAEFDYSKPLAPDQIRSFSGSIATAYKPIRSYYRTVDYQAVLKLGAKDLTFSNRTRESGSLKRHGQDLLWESMSASTMIVNDESKIQNSEMRILLTPDGNIKEINTNSAEDQAIVEALTRVLNSIRPKSSVRLGEYLWHIDDITQQVSPLWPDMKVRNNTLVFRAIGIAAINGRNNLVIDSSGQLEAEIPKFGQMYLRFPSQCLLDLPSGIWSGCVGVVRISGNFLGQKIDLDIGMKSAWDFSAH